MHLWYEKAHTKALKPFIDSFKLVRWFSCRKQQDAVWKYERKFDRRASFEPVSDNLKLIWLNTNKNATSTVKALLLHLGLSI